MQTYDATNWNLTGKLVNLEYGEIKSRTELSIIGVKSLLYS